MTSRTTVSRWVHWTGLFAFTLSLALPAYLTDTNGTPQYHFGFEAFLLGPVGLFAGHFSWLANLFLFRSWALRTRVNTRQSLFCAGLGLLVALSFEFSKTIAVGSSGEFTYTPGPGYFVWLLSLLLAGVAAHLYFTSDEYQQA